MSTQNQVEPAGCGEKIVVGLFILGGIFALKLLRSGSENDVTDSSTLIGISHKIQAGMANSANYLNHDLNFLFWAIIIISFIAIIAFGCALISFIKRKTDNKINKYSRRISYFLSPISLIMVVLFLIFHNSFFQTRDLRKLFENEVTEPNLVQPGQNVVVNLSNSTGVESINRNYTVNSFSVIKSEAILTNDSVIPLYDLKIKFKSRSEEMKKQDNELKISPQFEMTVPSDSQYNGAIINIEIKMTVSVPKFIKGPLPTYNLFNEDMQGACSFRVAKPSEIAFYNSASSFNDYIWTAAGYCLLIFILSMCFAGNSYYKPQIIKIEQTAELKNPIITDTIAVGKEFENEIRKTLIFISSSFADIDSGTTYKTIKIENQIWMGANLNVESFNNGDKLLYTQTPEEWIKAAKEGTPACCDYNNDTANGKKLGKIYNSHAVFDVRELSPKGWRLPSKNEFETLLTVVENFHENAYHSLIEGGNSGFNALLGGYCDEEGKFHEIGRDSTWWASLKYKESIAWGLNLNYFSKRARVLKRFKEFGFYIRCIKNEP